MIETVINDPNSFLKGVEVGLWMKVWDARRTPTPQDNTEEDPEEDSEQ